VVLVFHLLLRLFGHRTLIAVIGSFVFYLSGPMNSAQWEPHQEIASALFTAGFFIAWGLERQWIAVAMIVLNAMVREDSGMLLALPLFLLWAYDWWPRRGTRLTADRWTLVCALLSALLSVMAFAMKQLFFKEVDIVSVFYYGEQPFAHLSHRGRKAYSRKAYSQLERSLGKPAENGARCQLVGIPCTQ
jgi:hypothetical protein